MICSYTKLNLITIIIIIILIVDLINNLFVALITDLFMDRASFKGQHVKSKVPKLLELLDNCDIDSLLAFFEES